MEELVLTIVAVLGIFIALKFKGFFHKIISIGLAISFLLVWTDSQYIITGSFIALILLTIITFIYGLMIKEVDIFEKVSISIMGLFLAVSSISKLLHLSGVGVIKLSMAIPIIITLITFIRGKQLTKEMSFMIFWLFYAALEFLRLWI